MNAPLCSYALVVLKLHVPVVELFVDSEVDGWDSSFFILHSVVLGILLVGSLRYSLLLIMYPHSTSHFVRRLQTLLVRRRAHCILKTRRAL